MADIVEVIRSARGMSGAPLRSGRPYAGLGPICPPPPMAMEPTRVTVDPGRTQRAKDIHRAQTMAMARRFAVESPSSKTHISAQDFYGNWTDSFGNTVCVYSTDAYKIQLVASLVKPPRADIRLDLRPMPDGSCWRCGTAVLQSVSEHLEEIAWAFPGGGVSIWKRQVNTCWESSTQCPEERDVDDTSSTDEVAQSKTANEAPLATTVSSTASHLDAHLEKEDEHLTKAHEDDSNAR